jgi:hypothetical protein
MAGNKTLPICFFRYAVPYGLGYTFVFFLLKDQVNYTFVDTIESIQLSLPPGNRQDLGKMKG